MKFPRSSRLLKAAEFQFVFDKPLRFQDSHFSVLARRNDLTMSRLGLAISRKVSKSAVVRNRLKRLIRESFRAHQAKINGWDIVVMSRPAAIARTNAELTAALAQHWAQLKPSLPPVTPEK